MYKSTTYIYTINSWLLTADKGNYLTDNLRPTSARQKGLFKHILLSSTLGRNSLGDVHDDSPDTSLMLWTHHWYFSPSIFPLSSVISDGYHGNAASISQSACEAARFTFFLEIKLIPGAVASYSYHCYCQTLFSFSSLHLRIFLLFVPKGSKFYLKGKCGNKWLYVYLRLNYQLQL